METLLAAGADFSIRVVEDGHTALDDAARKGNAAVVSALVSAGVDKDSLTTAIPPWVGRRMRVVWL